MRKQCRGAHKWRYSGEAHAPASHRICMRCGITQDRGQQEADPSKAARRIVATDTTFELVGAWGEPVWYEEVE